MSNEPSEVFATFTELGLFEAPRLWFTTAQYGTMTRGPRIIEDEIKKIMRKHLREIQTGVFAREWALEMATGYPVFNKLRKESLEHPINEVEKKVRRMLRS